MSILNSHAGQCFTSTSGIEFYYCVVGSYFHPTLQHAKLIWSGSGTRTRKPYGLANNGMNGMLITIPYTFIFPDIDCTQVSAICDAFMMALRAHPLSIDGQ